MPTQTKKIVLIKLGGSVITDKSTPYKARKFVIEKLAKELKKIEKDYNIILSHGSGSFGHTSAKKYGGKKGYKSKLGISTVAYDVQKINHIVMDILLKAGIPAISLRPMSMILSKGGSTNENLFVIVEELLKQGLVPVVYGDVIWDLEWKSTIYSGEKTLNKIGRYLNAKGYKIDKIVQVGQTNGVFNNKKNLIPDITSSNWQNVKKFLFSTSSRDVTGGMEHKIDDALIMAKAGIRTVIVNGNIPNQLTKAAYDKEFIGTVVS